MANILELLTKGQNALIGQPNSYGGLVDEESQKQAQAQARMMLAASLLEAGGPSTQPTNFGQALGRGMMAGQQAQQGALDSSLKAMMLKQQLQKAQQQKKFMNVGAGGSIVDPTTGQVIYSNPAKTGNEPSNIAEWEYYNKLPPEDQKRYLEMKRNTQALQMVEYGGGKGILNKATGDLRPITTANDEATGAATVAGATQGAKTTAEATAQAQLDLPRVIDNAQQAIKTIDDFQKHPGYTEVFGMSSVIPVIPGTARAGAQAYYDQIQGKTFLEAFNSLKGAGQITETEGTKATAAIARLNQAQSEEDATSALNELKSVINAGLDRAKKKAGNASGAKPTRSRAEILKEYGL